MSSICELCIHAQVCEMNDKQHKDCDLDNQKCRYQYSRFISMREVEKNKAAINRMGEFGRLFVEYAGCSRGAVGRQCAPLLQEVVSMGIIKDVDGGEWVPVNKDALVELVGRYKMLAAMSGGDPFAKAYEREDNE